MADVIYSAGAFADLERIFDALEAEDPTLAGNVVATIRRAIGELSSQPLLGRPAEAGLRERAISRGRTGYVVLYRFVELDDIVLVAAVRHRHAAGYPAPN
jgi:plasmid stabilization system protein ParE